MADAAAVAMKPQQRRPGVRMTNKPAVQTHAVGRLKIDVLVGESVILRRRLDGRTGEEDEFLVHGAGGKNDRDRRQEENTKQSDYGVAGSSDEHTEERAQRDQCLCSPLSFHSSPSMMHSTLAWRMSSATPTVPQRSFPSEKMPSTRTGALKPPSSSMSSVSPALRSRTSNSSSRTSINCG